MIIVSLIGSVQGLDQGVPIIFLSVWRNFESNRVHTKIKTIPALSSFVDALNF